MVEYGNGVSQGAGQVGGGHAAGQSVDVGSSVGQWVTDSVHTVSTMPPAALLAAVVIVFIGLMLLKRAF